MAIEQWAEAFTTAQAEIPSIPKLHEAVIPTKTGGSYSYKYADLNDVLEVVLPVLNKHGLSVAQSPVSEEGKIGVLTRVYHTSGHVEEFGPLLLPAGGDARNAGSAITYARRYGLCAALGISPEDDDDAEAAVQQEPTREDVEVTPGDWLKVQVEVFGLWTPEQKRDAYSEAMKALEYERLSSLGRAKKVRDRMADAYYVNNPEAGLF